jgi:hypothetical protein
MDEEDNVDYAEAASEGVGDTYLAGRYQKKGGLDFLKEEEKRKKETAPKMGEIKAIDLGDIETTSMVSANELYKDSADLVNWAKSLQSQGIDITAPNMNDPESINAAKKYQAAKSDIMTKARMMQQSQVQKKAYQEAVRKGEIFGNDSEVQKEASALGYTNRSTQGVVTEPKWLKNTKELLKQYALSAKTPADYEMLKNEYEKAKESINAQVISGNINQVHAANYLEQINQVAIPYKETKYSTTTTAPEVTRHTSNTTTTGTGIQSKFKPKGGGGYADKDDNLMIDDWMRAISGISAPDREQSEVNLGKDANGQDVVIKRGSNVHNQFQGQETQNKGKIQKVVEFTENGVKKFKVYSMYKTGRDGEQKEFESPEDGSMGKSNNADDKFTVGETIVTGTDGLLALFPKDRAAKIAQEFDRKKINKNGVPDMDAYFLEKDGKAFDPKMYMASESAVKRARDIEEANQDLPKFAGEISRTMEIVRIGNQIQTVVAVLKAGEKTPTRYVLKNNRDEGVSDTRFVDGKEVTTVNKGSKAEFEPIPKTYGVKVLQGNLPLKSGTGTAEVVNPVKGTVESQSRYNKFKTEKPIKK